MMDGPSQSDLVEKILESASTRALGWILEQHCELTLTTTLEIQLISTNRVVRELLQEGETHRAIQQLAAAVVGRAVEIIIRDPNPEGDPPQPLFPPSIEQDEKKLQGPNTSDVTSQLSGSSKGAEVILWKGLPFHSQVEIRIADALDKRKVMFFPNCKGRLGFRERENRKPDFLVCYEGRWGIIEVDGEDYHPPTRTAEDHERDRLFKAHGILLIEHFDAGECWENADGVVKKFLELLRKAPR